MREETQPQLDPQQWLDPTSWLPALAVLFVLFGCLLAVHTTVRKERQVSGVVTGAVWRLNSDTGQQYSEIQVQLGNKRLVRASSLSAALPTVGQPVTLRKRAMLLGYTTYQWDGPATKSAAPAELPAAVIPVSGP